MWNDLKLEINICDSCNLSGVRINPIVGMGNQKAKILFVLDEVSFEEDIRKELLVGKNGEYFKKFLEYSKIDMGNCYFTTLTKCSSHGEIIKKSSIKNCKKFLYTQIALLNPEIIITVGENVTLEFIDTDYDIREIIGKIYNYKGGIKVIPIYDIPYLFRASDKEKWKLIKILENFNDSE